MKIFILFNNVFGFDYLMLFFLVVISIVTVMMMMMVMVIVVTFTLIIDDRYIIEIDVIQYEYMCN